MQKRCTRAEERDPTKQAVEESTNGHIYPQPINYLVIVDYFEYEKLSDRSAAAVIEICKRCFARLEISETVHSDNGPQFFAREFALFSNEWDFQHTTSSPYHSQWNGKAESSVKLAKSLMKRAVDPQLALLQ